MPARFAPALFLLLLLAACSAGPKILPGNRLDYNRNLQRSNEEELLLNIVRARYFEPPFFLQVGSISSNFGISAGAGAGARLYDTGTGLMHNNFTTLDLHGGMAENPTITYTPVQGETHAKRLLAEIGLDRLALLVRAGWRVDDVFRLLIKRIGPLENDFSLGAPDHIGEIRPEGFRGFLELCVFLRQKQDMGWLEINEEVQGQSQAHVLEVRLSSVAEARRLSELLDARLHPVLSPRGLVARFRLETVNSMIPPRGGDATMDTVPVRTRSFLQILGRLAGGVDVPAEDMTSGATIGLDLPRVAAMVQEFGLPLMISIHRSEAEPAHAAVMAVHRGAWYYVDDRDMRSKGILLMVGNLYALQAGDVAPVTPMLTIPVN